MKNEKITYNDMLDQLRSHNHTAPDQWDSLSEQLDIKEQLDGLKTYSPPEMVWDKIESALESNDLETAPKIRQMNLWQKAVRIAAVALILIGGCLWCNKQTDFEQYEYKSEIVYMAEVNHDVQLSNESLDESLESAQSFIEENDFLFQPETLENYHNQINELDEAVTDIKTMQEQYGSDESSMKLLVQMEREKAELIKSIINNAS